VEPPPTIAQLQDTSRYRRFALFPHSDIAATIRPHLYRWTPVTAAYWALNGAALLWLVVAWRDSGVSFVAGFSTTSLGMVGGYLLLLPVHEALHWIAYRMTGAREVLVHYEWRRITAHCVANRVVVRRQSFIMICFLPLAILNPLLLALGLAFPTGAWQLVSAAALLLHTGAVSGDVALVNLLWGARQSREVWTYDDVEAGQSYFFVTASPGTDDPAQPAD
jgi:hypothetical protein